MEVQSEPTALLARKMKKYGKVGSCGHEIAFEHFNIIEIFTPKDASTHALISQEFEGINIPRLYAHQINPVNPASFLVNRFRVSENKPVKKRQHSARGICYLKGWNSQLSDQGKIQIFLIVSRVFLQKFQLSLSRVCIGSGCGVYL